MKVCFQTNTKKGLAYAFTSLTIVALAIGAASPFLIAVQIPDPFDTMANWTTLSGSPQIDTAIGHGPPSLRLGNSDTQANTFGSSPQLDSLYLSNPVTTDFQDGTIEFDIFFDNDPQWGDQAVITFRMQGSDNYYGALLTNTDNSQSSFVVVRDGVVATIGNQSTPQPFPTREWSHVSIIVKGSAFTAFKDYSTVPLFSAKNASWTEGKWGGIGIYSAYYNGVFHIDNFLVHDTSRPLIFNAFFTSVITTTTTEVSTVHATTTSVSTSIVETTLSINTTVTSTVTQSRVPVPQDQFLLVLALVGLGASMIAGFLKSGPLAGIIVTYEFIAAGFVYTGMYNMWFTTSDAYRIFLGIGLTPLIGLLLGWFLAWMWNVQKAVQ